MLRFDPETHAAPAAASTEAALKTDAGDPDAAWIRWAPVFVPLSGGCVLFIAFVIWSLVL